MPSSAYLALREAMELRQQVVCLYQDRLREVCPHTLGYRAGREKVLTFQFAGDSSRGLPPGGEWRCMFVDQITVLETKDGEWHSADSHLRPQTCVEEIDLEVYA